MAQPLHKLSHMTKEGQTLVTLLVRPQELSDIICSLGRTQRR